MENLIYLIFTILIIYLFLKVLEELKEYKKEASINKKTFDKVMKQNKVIAHQNLSLLKRVAVLEEQVKRRMNDK